MNNGITEIKSTLQVTKRRITEQKIGYVRWKIGWQK